MNRWVICIASLFLTFYGCATSNALRTTAVSERNVNNLARLNLGMSEKQVLCIMKAPYKEEAFQSTDDSYDVWFYVTNPTVMSQTRMVTFNLTPISFRNKKLIGIGYVYYRFLRSRLIEKATSFNSLLSKIQFCHNPNLFVQGWIATSSLIEEMPICRSSNLIELPVNFFRNTRISSEEISMSSPKKEEPVEDREKKPPKKKQIDLDEKDDQMLDEADDQNFNYW
jgi:hypothetical protein